VPIELFKNEQNFIKYVLSHPCARPWYVYAETFAPAFLKLLVTVALLDVEDAIRAHGEKIAREGKGKKGKRHTPRIKTQGKVQPYERYMAKGLKTLLVITEPLEKIGFAWLLFSATDQFFYDWQTLLEQSDYCVDRGQSGPLTLSRVGGFNSLVVGFNVVSLPIESQDRAGWPHTTIVANIPFGSFTAIFACEVVGSTGGLTNLMIRLRTPGSIGADSTTSDPIAVNGGEVISMFVTHHFTNPTVGGGTLLWEIGGETVPVGIFIVKAMMSVFRDLPGGA